MKNTKEELLETICNIYLIFMMVVLPLYTNGTYYLLGDTKYYLFRNVSYICLGIWFVMDGIFLLRKKCSIVDICVLCYGACNVLSALFSSFRSTAWSGYADWHMGVITQLLLVGIYFLVSRCYAQDVMIIYLGEAALLAVTVIGLLNRLGVDPLRLYEGYITTDWEYSHMLSTLGNINWVCGYYSVMLALPMAGYIYSKRRWKQIFLFVVSLLGLTLLCIQGSDGGPVIAAVGLGICLLLSMNNSERFGKALLLFAATVLMFPVMGKLITLFEAQGATPIDGDYYAKMCWNGWWLIALFLGLVYTMRCYVNQRVKRVIDRALVILLVLTACGIVCLTFVSWREVTSEEWGSGRGALWILAWDAFWQGDWKQKLIGAGPDSFANYLIVNGSTLTVATVGRWLGTIYANAHNEWLTHLINIGILGVTCYLSIFVSSLKRYKGMLLGVLVLGMYGIHSLVSFQQVLNTPFFFLLLGLCENQCRKREISMDEQVTESGRDK